MNEYVIRVVETLAKSYVVSADSLEEAIEKTQQKYDDGDIVLEYDDFSEYEITESTMDLSMAKELLPALE
jgi:hypothetical protein